MNRTHRSLIFAALALALSTGCRQYDPLVMPAPVVVVADATVMTITTPGAATSMHEALVNVLVNDATGKGVPAQSVTLTTTAGTLNYTTVVTGPTGTAQAILTTETDATVTATSGALTASVAVKKHHVPPPPPPPSAPKPPPPVVTPKPPPVVVPVPTLRATVTCAAAPPTSPTPCNVNVTYGGVLLPATDISKVIWGWGDGASETTVPPTAPVATHPYASAGSYHVFATVTATTTDGDKTVTTSTAVVIK